MNMDPQEHKNSFSSEPQNHFEPVSVTLDEVLKNHTHEKSINLSGSDSLFSLAFFLTQSSSPVVKSQTNLVILPDQKYVEKFTKEVLFFNPDARVFALQEYDMNVYSGLYPSKKIVSRRVSWCYRAQNAKKSDIFVTSITGALQKTLPVDTLFDNSFHFQKDSDWEPGFLEHLQEIGYLSTPLVEDVGQVAVRGGIIDIFSPAHKWPIRLELFGNTIESLRFFDPETQRTIKECSSLVVIPPREVVLNKKLRQPTAIAFTNDLKTREVEQNEQSRSFLRDLSKGHYFQEIDYFLPYLYDQPTLPLNHFFNDYRCWHFKPQEITANADNLTKELKDSYISSQQNPLCPRPELIFANLDSFKKNITQSVYFDKVILHEHENDLDFEFRVHSLQEFQKQSAVFIKQPHEHKEFIKQKLHDWMRDSAIFISCQTEHQSQKIKSLLDDLDIKSQIVESHHYEWHTWKDLKNQNSILILPRGSFESMRIPSEQLVFLRDDDFFGHKSHNLKKNTHKSFTQSVSALNFGDLKSGDYVVHKQHGVGIYQNLTLMGIQGVDAEFIQIQYKGNDKLYLPVYRIGQIQKYSGPKNPQFIDKLGGTGWQKTQTKVKAHLRDLASELLNLYAKRSQTIRPPLSDPDSDYYAFENSFPFDETNDQLDAIKDILQDLTSEKPMDRLVCGDVGFGKTEVAMRAAFKVVQERKQVAVIAPTTILSFQHYQTFKKRFKDWPINIAVLNRFVPKAEVKKTIEGICSGEVDIIIGTHRLFSKDIEFKDLGLLVIDEEQKFGVKHKEKIRKIKFGVDTLALSATPIPRTLNLSLMGVRDLSLINTAPVDRLPTRTFVSRFDKEIIKKAVNNEISRGGQIFFLHNRVNSIYALEEELKSFLPDVRIAVAHGQMEEHNLEQTMLKFFNHEVDLLLCTTIIESGMDIPKANTMFIDHAEALGLSQLYQLRGRVGRSTQRAYCYLLVPPNKKLDSVAQERLRVIQENTALGSGIQIAHYDLELRGSGDILGKDQSGNINAVGYELYLELLQDAILEMKGEEKEEVIEPEINLKIPAFIPDQYISDIRIRLAYYKALSDVRSSEEIDSIEEDLRDQFGKPPQQVINLMGIMLIRSVCLDLKIKDISASASAISIIFSDNTPMTVDRVLKLTQRADKKYSLTPDSRLKIRIKEITWPRVYEELIALK